MSRNIMESTLEPVPAIIDYTAELQALRRFQHGEEIGNDMSLADLLAKIVTKATPRLQVIKKLHERYALEHIPTLHDRPVCDPMDIDNRLNNDFFSQIVNEKSGYFSGNPMTFSFDKEDEKASELFDNFKVRVRLDDINYETTKNCSIGGYDARLIYLKQEYIGHVNGVPKYTTVEAVKQIPAYEAILLGEFGYDEPEFGIRTFVYQDLKGNDVSRVELYMPFKAHIYEGDTINDLSPVGQFVNEIVLNVETGETATELGVIEYPFTKCPLYGYENNAELLGDAEPVLTLIDDYDRTTSDTSSELEANRGAYLAFFGVTPPKNGFDSTSTGTMYFKNDTNVKQDAKFITKDLPVAAKEAHLDRLERNIYLFSQTPNLTQKETGMAVSGEALRQRMMPLEAKTASFERKFVSGNIRMLECLRDFYKFAYGIEFDPYKVTQSFRRKMPENLEYEGKVFEMFKGVLPMNMVYGLLSFVDNPDELAAWYKENKADELSDLYNPPTPIDTGNGGGNIDGSGNAGVDAVNVDAIDK
ncbi:portal protein [Lysinibacillus phage vB_LspM-01]|nr:portal protein [Lysinibacillus phage vB_LspM-01]